MKSKIKKLENLTKEELENFLSTPQGFDRVLHLQEDSLRELREVVQNTLAQIRDKEETAARWLNALVILSLFQLFSFQDNSISRNFLILSLPSFIVAFYATALTLFRHPNYLKTDSFVVEEADKETRYNKNKAEITSLGNIYQSLYARYQSKTKYSGFIGSSVIVNFSVSVIFLIFQYILGVKFSIAGSLVLALLSFAGIYLLKWIASRNSFSITYKQDTAGNKAMFKH